MTLYVQLAVNGLALGAAYALIALGFVLILNATQAVNFAQGDTVMAGGYVAFLLAGLLPLDALGVPGLALLPLVLAAMALFGLVFSALAYFPLRRRPAVSVFISTIAVGILLQGAANGLFGGAERKAPPLVTGPAVPFGDMVVGRQTLAIILVAGLLIVLLHILLSHTQFGRRLRAAADDPAIARALGVRVTAMTAAAFAIAAALAGIAGLLLANQYFVTPTVGLLFMLKAYIAVTIGGWGNLKGAVIGALAIGQFEIFAATFVSTTVAEVALYGVLILVLVVRPQGLLGEPAGRRA